MDDGAANSIRVSRALTATDKITGNGNTRIAFYDATEGATVVLG